MIHLALTRLLIAASLCLLPLLAPSSLNIAPQARAATQISVEFHTALEPYGHWRHARQWGEVWVPSDVSDRWRPYTVGRWVYTDDYGWYWVSDEREADWGWVVYHYGRWVLDSDLGWVWVPGNEWAPAWVTWRRGRNHIGWAPLPPDRIIVEYRDEPNVWIFVRANDFVAPSITRVVLPPRDVRIYVRETVVVNRTVIVHEHGPAFAVNPGIPPTVVASFSGRPLRAYEVKPQVIAGTAQLPNAVEIREHELRQGKRQQVRLSVQESKTTIQPEKSVPQPKPLSANENGRLGDHPPKAAQANQTPVEKQPSASGKGPQEQNVGPKSDTASRPRGNGSAGKAREQSKQSQETNGKEAAERKPGGKPVERKEGDKSKAAEQKPDTVTQEKTSKQNRDHEATGRAAEHETNSKAGGKAAGQGPNAEPKSRSKDENLRNGHTAGREPAGATKGAATDQHRRVEPPPVRAAEPRRGSETKDIKAVEHGRVNKSVEQQRHEQASPHAAEKKPSGLSEGRGRQTEGRGGGRPGPGPTAQKQGPAKLQRDEGNKGKEH